MNGRSQFEVCGAAMDDAFRSPRQLPLHATDPTTQIQSSNGRARVRRRGARD